MLPFAGRNRVTSIFGRRTLNGAAADHKGLDIVGDDSHDVLAVGGGRVIQSHMVTDRGNLTWEWGNYVCVQAQDGLLHYYCHMGSRAVQKGDVVKEGDKIGVMGNTGKSYGAHLHFELRNTARQSLNPCPLLGIPNQTGSYTGSAAGAPCTAKSAAGRVLQVYGGAKGLNVQAFTGKDVSLVAKNGPEDIRVPDGAYQVLTWEGSAGGYQWCRIDYQGQPVYMPYGGILDDRCQLA